jgi:hypothetical protein
MDQHIRASIDEALRVRGLTIECHHASWRDGGLSYPSLVDRRRVLLIRSFGQMMLSKDKKVRETIRWLANDERDHRGIQVDRESNFLDWKDEHGRKGTATATLTVRTRKACKKMIVTFKLINGEMQLKNQESEYQTKTADGIGHYLTQTILRPEKRLKLLEHKCHGASFTTLGNNQPSNAALTDVHTRRTDAFIALWWSGELTVCQHQRT